MRAGGTTAVGGIGAVGRDDAGHPVELADGDRGADPAGAQVAVLQARRLRRAASIT